MLGDDEGPKDWEIKDEEPPDRLQQKWEREESEGFKRAVCPSCKKETPAENLTCIFCGTDLDYKNKGDQCRPNHQNKKEIKSLDGVTLLRESCPIRCFLTWVKRLFRKG